MRHTADAAPLLASGSCAAPRTSSPRSPSVHPTPLREIPARPSRAIHFFDPSNEKMASKIPDMVGKVDVLLGNLEDAIKADNKLAAREGLVKIARRHRLRASGPRSCGPGSTRWTRPGASTT